MSPCSWRLPVPQSIAVPLGLSCFSSFLLSATAPAGLRLTLVLVNYSQTPQCPFHAEPVQEYLIADAALYTKETLPVLKPIHWISRVPETLSLAGHLIHAIAPDGRAQPDKPAFRSLSTVYGEVRQRGVVVYSPPAYHRSRKTIDRPCLQQSTAELKAFDKLCQHDFACAEDAQKALVAFTKTQRLTELTDPQVEALPRYHGKGRPARGRAPDFYVYRTTGTIASLPAQRLRRLERKSCFILATNQLDHDALSDEELIAAYKAQQKVERGFRFLKDPLFMASTLFLESPQRIMALMMIMTLCLLVYAALEHRLRGLENPRADLPEPTGQARVQPDRPLGLSILQWHSSLVYCAESRART